MASSTIILFLSFGLGVFFMCTPTTAFPNPSIEEDFFDTNNTCIVNVTKPNCTKCAKGSYAPYPSDPTMFYQCNNGKLYPMHCMKNTVWNQTEHTCVNDDFFDTNNTCIVNVTKPNCTKCAKGSYAPYPNDPTMFYQCNNGKFYPMHCMNNTVWNQTEHTCVNDETFTTNGYDSHSNPTNVTSPTSKAVTTYTPFSSTTTKPNTQEFDGPSFGGGIAAGIGIALIVLLLIRCCCHSPSRDGYEQHI